MAEVPHIVMIPYPAQGHVIPLLELAQHLANQAINITFINTHSTHSLILNSTSTTSPRIRLVSVPDGLEPNQKRVPEKFLETVHKVIPERVKEFVEKMDDQVRCVVYDVTIGRIADVAKLLGIGSVAFLPTAAALFVVSCNIPRMIRDGIIDDEGTSLKKDAIQLEADMVAISPLDFVWNRIKIPILRQQVFSVHTETDSIKQSEWIICNSVHDLEPGVFTHHSPCILPIGPLLASIRAGKSGGHFQVADNESIDWLDQQLPGSVIYAAFGSTTVLSTAQLHQLALALELTNKPFLWVIPSPSSSNIPYPDDGFLSRILDRARMVRWAPQQEVLQHPSIGCFVSHCGWNSTLESISNGVPMVCWPYSSDQFMNQAYACDVWGIGVRVGEGEIVGWEEIKGKIEEVMDEGLGFRKRALQVKEMVGISVRDGGKSFQNFREFVGWIHKG